jgi:REP element-mobilizing transposase RayT
MARTHGRRQLRLRGWDYSRPTTYSITICTINSADLLGEVVRGNMVPNGIGEIVADCWQWLGRQFAHVGLDEWTLMPTHMHGILVLSAPATEGETSVAAPSTRLKPLGQVIGAFKTRSTKEVNQLRGTPRAHLWQRDFWDQIIHDEYELSRAREYIRNNPANYRPRMYKV